MGSSLSTNNDESHRAAPNGSLAADANSSSSPDSPLTSGSTPQTISSISGNNNNVPMGTLTQAPNFSDDLSRQSASATMDPTSVGENSTTAFPINGTTATNSSEDFKLNLFGTYIYPFRWMTLPTLYSWLGPASSLAMILGCVLPYVPQYATIRKNQSCSGFSTYVCLTLLLANILRIAFWFGHPFELPLLIQSIIMIIAQILLLELCVRIKRQNSHVRKTFLSFNLRYLWHWTDLSSYLAFLFLITALLGAAVYLFIDCKPFIESLGYCALVTESMLGLPQVIKNYQNRSVQGMSLSMVLMWLAGDTFKTGYFISNAVPYQFWLCGLLQITIDLLILFQVCLYRQNAPIKKKGQRVNDSPKEMMPL